MYSYIVFSILHAEQLAELYTFCLLYSVFIFYICPLFLILSDRNHVECPANTNSKQSTKSKRAEQWDFTFLVSKFNIWKKQIMFIHIILSGGEEINESFKYSQYIKVSCTLFDVFLLSIFYSSIYKLKQS